MRLLGASIVLLLLAGCSSSINPVAVASASPSAGASVSPPATPSTAFQPTAIPSTTATPIDEPPPTPTSAVAQLSCQQGRGSPGDPLALVSGSGGHDLIFDVADPIRPRLLCLLTNAWVEFVAKDELAYLTRNGSGPLPVYRLRPPQVQAAGISFNPDGYLLGWRLDGTLAYAHSSQGPSDPCCGMNQVHVVSAGTDRVVCSYQVGMIGIGGARFYNRPLAAFSADGRYFAYTSFSGKAGTSCNFVLKTSDGSVAAALPDGLLDGFWSNLTNRLYYLTPDGVATWDEKAGIGTLTSDPWIAPRIGPGGDRVAYTYFLNKSFAEADVRVGIFDLQAGATVGGLPNKPRSEAAFVTPTLLWYLEEGPCTVPSGCFTGDISPTGRVLAFDTVTGLESPVIFAPGESPVTVDDFQSFNVSLPPA